MAAAGYATANPDLRGPNGWRGSLKETEERIKTLKRQRAEAQAALDAALLNDDERTTLEAKDKVFRDVINTMRIKHGTDGGLVALTADGDYLDVADMTPAQRMAFERLEAAHLGPRETVSA